MENVVDKTTHWVKEYNHSKSQSIKSQILISFSQRISNYHIIRLNHKDSGLSKDWNTFTISRDGKIYQHYDSKYYGNYIGIKDVDKQSISIVIENMGSLSKNIDNLYYNWLNEVCDSNNVVEKKMFGYNYWEKLQQSQLNSLVLICNELCEIHEIPNKCIDFNHYHKDIIKYSGIVFGSNYCNDSMDINPTFNIEEFNLKLWGE